ncbi:DUF1799 domain-containing protein [Bilophila wadsworthia]|uniref:DUF1799 domain-containing protein n=1 Tax=Bilophila wadsworthia TaxID=35833 RepID=UPI00345F9537
MGYCRDCRRKLNRNAPCATCAQRNPLWPELAPLASLWLDVQGQWRTGWNGPTGMDWQGVRTVAKWIGLSLTSNDFYRLSALERDTLQELAERKRDE